MARTTATNFSGGLQFPYATAAADVFHKEDIQTLAQAVDQHDHTAGKGHSVNTTPANASITNAMLGSDVARANLLTNGSMGVWQRGTGAFTANLAYTADRWQISLNGTSTMSVTQQTSTPPPGSSSQSVLDAVYTHNTASAIIQTLKITTDSLRGVAGRPVSVSMSLYTATASAVRLVLATDGSSPLNVQSAYHPGDSTWHVLTVTGTVPADATYLQVQILLSASNTVLAANAMLVVGSQPCDYVPLHPADDLARCLRYFQYIGTSGVGDVIVSGIATAGGQTIYTTFVCAEKAVSPTVTIFGTWGVSNSGQPAVAATSGRAIRLSAAASAAGQFYTFNGTAGNYIQLEANP